MLSVIATVLAALILPPPAVPSCHARARGVLPDRSCTPGFVSQRGPRCAGTRSVRPPTSYTNRLKRIQIRQYGYRDTTPAHYQEDHLVPLALGGHPSDPRNLWPEPLLSARIKDRREYIAIREVCARRTTNRRMQELFAFDWRLVR